MGITIQELLAYYDVDTDHIAIRTSFYRGIDERRGNIRIHETGYLIDNVNKEDSLLIVDDIFDTGTDHRGADFGDQKKGTKKIHPIK